MCGDMLYDVRAEESMRVMESEQLSSLVGSNEIDVVGHLAAARRMAKRRMS